MHKYCIKSLICALTLSCQCAETLKSSMACRCLNYNEQWRQAINIPTDGLWKVMLFYGSSFVLCQGSNWISAIMHNRHKQYRNMNHDYVCHVQCFYAWQHLQLIKNDQSCLVFHEIWHILNNYHFLDCRPVLRMIASSVGLHHNE